MMQEHEDPKFDAWLQNMAQSYHAPRTTPREEMWQRIEDARRNRHVIELRPWMRWAVAAAAVLVIGIGIGRWTAHNATGGKGSPVATAPDSSQNLVYQVAAMQYFSRTETFLTSFRADDQSGASNARFARQARDLLTTAQLMLDSPAASDPRLRALLEDLELVLMQISQLDVRGGTHDTDFITQGMNQSNVLPKLRSAIPSGPVPVRTEGAL